MRETFFVPGCRRSRSAGLAFLLLAAWGCADAPPVRPAEFCDDPLPPGGWFRIPREGRGPSVAAFSPDGRLLATASRAGPIRLWDSATGADLGAFGKSEGAVSSLAFAPDGRRLASAGHGEGGCEIRVWDVATRAHAASIPVGPKSASNLAFSPGGDRLSALCEGDIRTWNPAIGERTGVRKGPFEAFSLSGDGFFVAAVGPESAGAAIRLWREGFSRARWSAKVARVSGLWFSSVRRGIVVAFDGASLSWLDAGTGTVIASRPIAAPGATASALSPDGRTLALASPQGVSLFEAATGEPAGALSDRGAAPATLAFSPDGRLLAAGAADGSVVVWELGAGFRLDRLWTALASADPVAARAGVDGLVSERDEAAAFLGSRLAATPVFSAAVSDLLARLDRGTGEERDQAADALRRVGESAEPILRFVLDAKREPPLSVGARLRLRKLLRDAERDAAGASPSGELLRRVRSIETLERIGTPAARSVLSVVARQGSWTRARREAEAALARLGAASGAAAAALPAVLPDARPLLPEGASAGVDLREAGAGEKVLSIAISPDGGMVALGGPSGSVLLWEPGSAKGLRFLDGASGDISALAFSNDGRALAAGAADGAVTRFDLPSGAPGQRRERCPGGVRALAFSGDGIFIAAAGGEGVVRILDAAGAAAPRRFADDEGACLSLAFLLDGQTLVAAWANGTVRIGPIGVRRPKTKPVFAAARLAALSPDGRLLAWVADAGLCIQEASGSRVFLKTRLAAAPCALAFSGDGRVVAAAFRDGTIRLWETATGAEAGVRKARASDAVAIAFSRGGRVASASAGEALLWDASVPARDLETIWDDLASMRAGKAPSASARLVEAGAAGSSFLRERLRPAPIPSGRLEELLAELGGGETEAAAAEREIVSLGVRVEETLREFLGSEPPEAAASRANAILERLRASRLRPPEGESLRRARAVAALERIADAQSLASLEEIAQGDPDPRLRDEARSSLSRILRIRSKK
ncbi:MAG: hypothetical protein AAB215_01640 [Planctomycetota bacterium]